MSKYFTIIILIVLLLLPQLVSAAGLVPCGGENEPRCNLCHIFQMLQTIIQGATIAILAWAGLFILIGGIIILTSAGSAEQASKGKRTITYAIIGIIVAFGSWLIINTIMNALVNPEVLPWKAWNKIECEPTEPLFTHKECVEGVCKEVEGAGTDQCTTIGAACNGEEEEKANICRCELKDNSLKFQTYSTAEGCQNKCEDWCSTFANWDNFCCVEEEDQTCLGFSPKDKKKYCICEIPVYTLDPNQYPNQTEVVGTEITGTDLGDEESCTQGCSCDGNSYCASQNELESKGTHCVELRTPSSTETSLACFSTAQSCAFSVVPDKPEFNKDCARNCWIDGNFYCECTTGQATWCTSSKPYGLYKKRIEKGVGTYHNAYDCIRYCGVYAGESCRLGSFPELPECGPEEVVAEWRFQSGVQYQEEQKADATTALKNFLDCFYEKAPSNIAYISAITDKDIYNGTCNPQDCKKDTCTLDDCGAGKPCDHSCGSCHYGGTCTSTKSYAVDFGDEQNVCQIADSALQCSGVNKIFGPQSCGGKVTVDGYHNDHVHISVINSCNCN